MNDYEECLKKFNDPEMCRFGQRATQLAEALRLEDCLERHRPQKCLDICLKNCKEKNCNDLCLNAMDMAAAKSLARRLVQGAIDAASETGITVPEAAAMGFYMLLNEPGDDCVAKIVSMKVLGLVVMELKKLLGVQELLLLLAPTIAMAYECIGDDAFNLLDTLAPTIGWEMAERIAAALEEGVVKIGNIALKFPPAKPT
jgi:hypothetical protein